MASCKWAEFLYAAVPSRIFRDFLIRNHMDRCERCQARLVELKEARALFVQPGDISGADARWWKTEMEASRLEAVRADPRVRGARFRWEWAVGAATLLMTAGVSLWLLRGIQAGDSGDAGARVQAADRFEINRLSVGGLPAQAYIYRLKDSDTIFVWAAKTP
jgi:hypothetical protein